MPVLIGKRVIPPSPFASGPREVQPSPVPQPQAASQASLSLFSPPTPQPPLHPVPARPDPVVLSQQTRPAPTMAPATTFHIDLSASGDQHARAHEWPTLGASQPLPSTPTLRQPNILRELPQQAAEPLPNPSTSQQPIQSQTSSSAQQRTHADLSQFAFTSKTPPAPAPRAQPAVTAQKNTEQDLDEVIEWPELEDEEPAVRPQRTRKSFA
jgi:hypothetical protein